MTAVTDRSADHFVQEYERWERRLADASPPWLLPVRKAALARFAETGLPTTKDEDWRYTNVSFLARREFRIAEPTQAARPDLERFRTGAAPRLVFVDGRWAPELSAVPAASGVVIAGLAQALASQPQRLEPHLVRHAEFKDEPFTALNTALVADGAFIEIAGSTVVEEPIELLFVSTGATPSGMTNPRVVLVAGPESQAAVVEHHVSLDRDACFTNAVTEVNVAAGARIDHYLLGEHSPEAFAVMTLRAEVGCGGVFSTHPVLLGGALVRSNVHVHLAGEGSDVLVNGLYVGDHRQHLDNFMRIVHAQPHGTSRQFYHGILDDQAHGVFTGRIIVKPGAQKTDAKQSSRSLLLSPNAEANSRPQLEIYADDVKCTHGSTTGQIDPDALFYLRSRAMPEPTARSLLTYAFASESLDRMPCESVRRYLESRLLDRLPHGRTMLAGAHLSSSNIIREFAEP